MAGGVYHEPAMVEEVMRFLAPGAGHVIVDGTLGGGGHAEKLLSWAGPGTESIKLLIGIDRDGEAIKNSQKRLERFGERAILRKANYRELKRVLADEGMEKVNGILLDLGASRHQLTDPARGFSFMEDSELDMRMDREEGRSVADLLAAIPERELADLIRRYGEDRNARRIARAIVNYREEHGRIETTGQLRSLIESASRGPKKEKIHPATRTFMALRIAVNRELEGLEEVLADLPDCLGEGGRAVIMSYHSLEDRLVKRAFAAAAKGCVCPPDIPRCVCGKKPVMRVLTRKPVTPSEEEIRINPAARSSKLRAAEKISPEDN